MNFLCDRLAHHGFDTEARTTESEWPGPLRTGVLINARVERRIQSKTSCRSALIIKFGVQNIARG
ncbi:hypothetical protein WS75_19330 [Burkholderia sp. FL-7-2-10-S1-D7]|nr:hypothetical protein WS75_19330 [Burkholderia sp. FL-7-2-10-S1-D7]